VEQSNRAEQSANDSYIFLNYLKEKQKVFSEGTTIWADYQSKIDQVVAERYLEYVNR
jgi:hypothetical protein